MIEISKQTKEKHDMKPISPSFPVCKKLGVEFVCEDGFWKSKIGGAVVLTYKQEGACKRNTEKHLTRHDGYYAKLYV